VPLQVSYARPHKRQLPGVEPEHQRVASQILVRKKDDSDLRTLASYSHRCRVDVPGLFSIHDLAYEVQRGFTGRVRDTSPAYWLNNVTSSNPVALYARRNCWHPISRSKCGSMP
jgi:hypothetical protein